ncbi:hypothetical protein CK203_088732 [Vitis vinifera]|uniref:Uncharacterized protein n=1 Tax=Vitis vinifera TaxID=29760 RepID=A0A438CLT9_VITVI|nr:hypothetical protein CK203_088732 [Vitis vinifera]
MSSKKKATSSSRASDVREKATDKLDVKEFRDWFCIPNGVIVELLNDEEHVRAPAIPSIGDGTARLYEGRGEGIRGGPGWMGGVIRASGRPFSPNYSLVIPGPEKKEPPRGLVEKASFACLSKLFEIDAKERHCKTLLTARNLMAVIRESQEISPIYQALKEADAEKRRALLDNREKKKNEGTLRKAPGQKRDAASPSNKAPAKRRKLVKNGKGVKEPTPPQDFAPPPITHEAELPVWLTWLRRLHPSTIRTPLIRMSMQLKRLCGPNRGSGGRKPESALGRSGPSGSCSGEGSPSKRPRSARNLRFGLIGRLQDRRQEIEVSCSSAYNAPPEGVEVEVATKTLAVLVVPNEDAPGEPHPAENVEAPNPEQESPSVASSSGDLVNDVSCTSASPFSYTELEDKLKQIPPGLTSVMPSAKMFKMVELLVSGLRGMANQYDLFTDLLRTTDYMKAFAARHKDTEDQLRLRLGRMKPAYPPPGGRMKPSGQI